MKPTGDEVETSGSDMNEKANEGRVVAIDHDTETHPEKGEVASTPGWSEKWSQTTRSFQTPIKDILLKITHYAARYPKMCIGLCVLLSLSLASVGLLTNFNINAEEDRLFTPEDSRSWKHGRWIEDSSGFPKTPAPLFWMIHSDGGTVLAKEAVRRDFAVLDTVVNTPGFHELCAKFPNPEKTCPVFSSATDFWDGNFTLFESQVDSDEELVRIVSSPLLPDGTPMESFGVFGNHQERDSNGTLTFASAIMTRLDLPEISPSDERLDFEELVIDRLLKLRDEWIQEEGNVYRLELFAQRSFSDEFTRAIVVDVPLMPLALVVMSIFTCIVFFRPNWLASRSLVGFGAVVSIVLSLVASYGLLFTCGITFTSMTQVLPFVMFGIGLDDAFIIAGAHERTNRSKTPEERIHETIEEVGFAVFLTTLTSALAFGLGSISSIPAVRWLCFYAFPSIIIDFLYQITFFIAILILDDRRVRKNKRDCLVCFTAPAEDTSNDNGNPDPKTNPFDKLMGRFAVFLCRPLVKIVVVLSFVGLFVGCAFSAAKLTQEFHFTEVVPSDSYVKDFWNVFDDYLGSSGVWPCFYFRFVSQSDPEIQRQMQDFVNDVVASDLTSRPPPYFWLNDFHHFVNTTESVQDLRFEDQMTAFLEDSVYDNLYRENIVRNEDGDVTESRSCLQLDLVNQDDVKQQVSALRTQRGISAEQPVNQGRRDWPFFLWSPTFYNWDFYAATPDEITMTTLIGIISVTVIGLLFIPHWSAAPFIFVLISMLYVDLLGTLQFAGLHINAVTGLALGKFTSAVFGMQSSGIRTVSLVIVVMSIGLLVDFVMHVLLKFHDAVGETREAKMKGTLQTMGASILLGALSTFLGVIPLAFSTSSIFHSLFVAFFALVTLGAGHGLILLPVMLSIFGPTTDGPAGKGNEDVTDIPKETNS